MKPPFDILEAYAFMAWMWHHYPVELVEYAQEYAADKNRLAPIKEGSCSD